MADPKRLRGWKWDGPNAYLETWVDGTSVAVFNDSAPYLTVANGLTITTGGLTVTAGGLTVTAGGLTVTAGGVTVTAGSLKMTAGANYIILGITDTDGTVEGSLWYDASEDKLKFKTAAGVETVTSA